MIYGTVSVEKYMFLRILYCSFLFDVPYSTKFRFIIIFQCTGFTTVSWGWFHPTVIYYFHGREVGLSDGLLVPRYLSMWGSWGGCTHGLWLVYGMVHCGLSEKTTIIPLFMITTSSWLFYVIYLMLELCVMIKSNYTFWRLFSDIYIF